jgi:hypothetical protein
MQIRVKVKPGAPVSELTAGDDGLWLARLKAPPVDGKANQELIVLVARHFGRPKSAVSIKSGAGARTKVLNVQDD